MADTLTLRALNRATLGRQLLLRRHDMPARQAVAHLAGMQAQAPLAPYAGLWTRLENFKPEDLSTLISERAVLRAHLNRGTVHLVTAEDYLDARPLFQRLGESGLRANFGKRLTGVDLPELATRARDLLAGGAQSPRTVTRAELGRLLAPSWPGTDPSSLAYAASYLLPLAHVPPRGIWGKTGQATFALADEWLGRPIAVKPDPAAVDRLVLRCVGAFGPVTVNDIQAWSGLTRLREVTERLAGCLRNFRGPGGEELLDLPDADRPDPDTPAPPRFLPEYDNLLLSHADRARVIPHGRPVPLPPGNGSRQGTLLIDGLWNATWKISYGILEIAPFLPLTTEDTDAIATEGARLLAFAGVKAGAGAGVEAEAGIRFLPPG